MLSILADTMFGKEIDNVGDILIWFIIAQVALIVAISVLVIFAWRTYAYAGEQPAEEPQEDEKSDEEQQEPTEDEQPIEEQGTDGDIEYPDEDSAPAGVLHYDRSFTARLIQAGDYAKSKYTLLKNELLSYKGVKARMSWKRETYKVGRQYLARLTFRGKTLCIFFPLKASEYEDSRYQLEEPTNAGTYSDTPAMYRIKNDKHFRLAMELIAQTAEKMQLERVEHESVDYYMPYEGTVELIEKGLIRREIRTKRF